MCLVGGSDHDTMRPKIQQRQSRPLRGVCVPTGTVVAVARGRNHRLEGPRKLDLCRNIRRLAFPECSVDD